MFRQLVLVNCDLPHLLVDVGVVIAFPTFIADPSRDILDDNEGLTMSEIFTASSCFEFAFTAADADFTCHIYCFFRFHTLSL